MGDGEKILSDAPERIYAVDAATRFWFKDPHDLHNCVEYIRADLKPALNQVQLDEMAQEIQTQVHAVTIARNRIIELEARLYQAYIDAGCTEDEAREMSK